MFQINRIYKLLTVSRYYHTLKIQLQITLNPGPAPGPAPGPDPDPGPAPGPDPAPGPGPAPDPDPAPAPDPDPAPSFYIQLRGEHVRSIEYMNCSQSPVLPHTQKTYLS